MALAYIDGWPYQPTDTSTADIGAVTQAMAQESRDREVHEWTQAELDALDRVGLRPGRLFVLRPESGPIRLLRWDGQAMRDVSPSDPIATNAGLRTLGTGAQQAARGDIAHDDLPGAASRHVPVGSSPIGAGTAPSVYSHVGLRIDSVTTTFGWPVDGVLTTAKASSSYVSQTLVRRGAPGAAGVAFFRAATSDGAGWSTWAQT